jgi:hypothetical protein
LVLPAWLKFTVQLVTPLIIVMEAEPLPPPLHPPEVVIATGNPELAVAATLNEVLYIALTGACAVTVIVWLALTAVVELVKRGAAL